jgi:uncharacterized protein YraI
MNKFLAPFAAAMVLCAGVPMAHAQQEAFTAKSVHLRAGPARDYPVVAVLAPQVGVTVLGCLSNYVWCDVAVGPHRGWVYAPNLRYYYQSDYVPLPSVAAAVGVGVLVFVLDDYWHDHYRERRWYPLRQRWYKPVPHPQFSPPPVPPPRAAPPVRRVPPGRTAEPPGPRGTPPGHGGTPPGHGGTPPGRGGTPPGHRVPQLRP